MPMPLDSRNAVFRFVRSPQRGLSSGCANSEARFGGMGCQRLTSSLLRMSATWYAPRVMIWAKSVSAGIKGNRFGRYKRAPQPAELAGGHTLAPSATASFGSPISNSYRVSRTTQLCADSIEPLVSLRLNRHRAVEGTAIWGAVTLAATGYLG